MLRYLQEMISHQSVGSKRIGTNRRQQKNSLCDAKSLPWVFSLCAQTSYRSKCHSGSWLTRKHLILNEDCSDQICRGYKKCSNQDVSSKPLEQVGASIKPPHSVMPCSHFLTAINNKDWTRLREWLIESSWMARTETQALAQSWLTRRDTEWELEKQAVTGKQRERRSHGERDRERAGCPEKENDIDWERQHIVTS